MKLKHCWWKKPKVLVVFICIVSFLDFKLVNKSVEIWSPVLGSSLYVCDVFHPTALFSWSLLEIISCRGSLTFVPVVRPGWEGLWPIPSLCALQAHECCSLVPRTRQVFLHRRTCQADPQARENHGVLAAHRFHLLVPLDGLAALFKDINQI